MTTARAAIGALAVILSGAPRASAADVSKPIESAALCAPRAIAGDVPRDAPRIIGAQDTIGRTLFGARELVVIDGGAGRGLRLGQQFFIRRPPGHAFGRSGLRGLGTSGGLQIVALNEVTAIGLVDFACDGILVGDFLEPYAPPSLPADVDRTDTTGELDFSTAGHVLFGNDERRTGAQGDFMVADIGTDQGAEPGARFGIYRNVGVAGLPLEAIGEAIVVAAARETSVIRITSARHAIDSGDLLIPRRKKP